MSSRTPHELPGLALLNCLLGVAPWSSLLELGLRVLAVYFVLVVAVRFLGRYLEADGSFSFIAQDPPRPGLALVPVFDAQLRAELRDDWAHVACAECGHLRERHAVEASCRLCASDAWVPPVKPD